MVCRSWLECQVKRPLGYICHAAACSQQRDVDLCAIRHPISNLPFNALPRDGGIGSHALSCIPRRKGQWGNVHALSCAYAQAQQGALRLRACEGQCDHAAQAFC
jgi:hypothetical protein